MDSLEALNVSKIEISSTDFYFLLIAQSGYLTDKNFHFLS